MVLKSLKPDIIIPEIPFAEYILKSCYARRDKVAIIEAATGRQLTFGEVADQVVRCASALYKTGLRKGDVVATCASNSPEYLIVILAVTACGGVVTTCNPIYTVGEIRQQFQHSEPKIAFCVPGNIKTIHKVSEFIPSLQLFYTIGEVKGVESFASLLNNGNGSDFPRVDIDVHEDLAFLPYSSGTTGLPKRVMLTHHNMVSVLSLFKVSNNLPTECRYSCLPLFHIGGLIYGFGNLEQGGKLVLDDRFDVKNMFSYIEKYKVTMIMGMPPILLAMEKSPWRKKYDLSSVRGIFSGAAPHLPPILDSLSQKMGCGISLAWGLTEGVPVTLTNPLVTPFSSVGNVCPNTKLKVIDVVTGKELGPGQDGELCVKSPQVMKGYFKKPEETAKTIDVDGWLHTGDIGYYDENEMVYIVDRLKELIKYKGFQVAPVEVESVLLGHSKIEDAAVVGIPNSEAGEVAKAYIVKKDSSLTAAEINDYLLDKLIKYKHLHGGIEFCSSIPKTASGKIL